MDKLPQIMDLLTFVELQTDGSRDEEFRQGQLKAAERSRQKLLDMLRHSKRGALNRQALADYAEWRFADNEEMAKQAGDINREQMYEPFDEEAQYYYGGASRYIEGAVGAYNITFLVASRDVNRANLFEQKLIELVTQEVTDHDHPVWRSSRLIKARQPQTETPKGVDHILI